MSDLHSIDRVHPPLGKRGAFEGVARRPWMAGGMGMEEARTTATTELRHSPQRWVEKWALLSIWG